MKLIRKIKKADSTSFRKCKGQIDNIYSNLVNSLSSPNYIVKYMNGLDSHEVDEVIDDLEDCLENIDKLKKNIENTIKALKGL